MNQFQTFPFNKMLLAILVLPVFFIFSGFAQTEQEIIDQYLNGTLTNISQYQKDIIAKYYDENVVSVHTFPRNLDDIRVPFFLEDFSGIAGDSVSIIPPTGWQNVVNAGGNPAQPWEFYTATHIPGNSAYTIPSGGGFSGDYAVLNSDRYGSGNTQNVSLITPAINCTGRDWVYLSFSEQFRAIGTSSGTVSVSTDGGNTWTDLIVRTGVSVGYPNPAVETSILVPQATNQADVRFRFTYVGSWGYWWALDNIALEEGDPLVPLIGGNVYPINGTNNPPVSFENITSAIAYMNVNGVSGTGQVILELSTGYAGTEPGPVNIGPIFGTSSNLGVTFRPAAGYTAITEIAGGASPNQHAFSLSGASYINFDGRSGGTGNERNWTIKVTGSGTTGLGQMALRLQNNAANMTDINIRNLILIGEAANTTGAVFQITGVTGNTVQNVIVEDNLITSTATVATDTRGYGMTIAVATNIGNTGLIVRNNDITNFYNRGINITAAYPQAQYYGNRIYHTVPITQPSTIEFSGIYYSSSSVNGAGTEIHSNMVYNIQLTNHLTTTTTGITGIYIFATPTSGEPIKVYNNVISLGQNLTGTANDANVFGIRENTGTTALANIFYNSVYIGGEATTGANNSAAFRKQLSNNLNLSNNIFYNARSNNGGTGTHWGIMTNNTLFSSISNNAYYVSGTGGVLGTTNGTAAGNQLTIGDWLAAVSSDQASVFVNPNFMNPTATPPNLMVNESIASPIESGGITITGITTDFNGTPRFPNTGYPENPLYPATAPDIGAYEFAGEPADISPPIITYTSLPNTSSITNIQISATITDPSGVVVGVNGPRLYFKKNFTGAYLFDSNPTINGDDYTFTIDHVALGITPGDSVYYYFAAQDSAGNTGTNPAGGSGINPPGTTAPDNPDSYLIVPPALSGDYTIGVALFKQLTGLDINFDRRVRTIEVEETIIDPVKEEQIGIYEETIQGTVTIQEPADEADLVPITITRIVEQEYYVPMLNGQEYEGQLFHLFTENQIAEYNLRGAGVYPTITAAMADANLRGVSGPVNFILLDATYPSETFPIVFGDINGMSATNTITLRPDVGVTSAISASINQPIFDFVGASNFIIDGRSGGVGNSINLKIENLSTTSGSHTIRLGNGSTYNTIQYTEIINSSQPTAGPRAIDIPTSPTNPSGNSFNTIAYNLITGGRTGIGFAGTAANLNTDNVIVGNKISDFSFAGVWFSSNASNTTVEGNEFFHTQLYNVQATAISMAASANQGVTNIVGNKFYDLQNSTTSTLRVISGTPGTLSTTNIVNNFFSLTLDNGTKTSIYAVQISGTTEFIVNAYYNSFRLGGTHTGGSAGTIISGGLVKSNTGAASTFNYKNNISINNRSGGTASTFHTNFFIGTTAIVGTLDIDYNVNFATGGTGAFNAGWNNVVYNDQQAYRDSAAPYEQNTIFKNVEFVSNTDLHLAGSSIGDMDLGGIPIPGITVDIDGDPRDPDLPYRGADESDPLIVPPFLTIFERSAANGNLPSWFGADTERGLSYGFTSDGTDASNHRVFVVSRNAGLNVRILDAVTGADVGTLNTIGITGGTFALNDVGVTDDGKIIAANLVAPTGDFKLYMWDNELSTSVNIITYAATVRLGDKITVTGNYSAGTAQIWAASATTGQHLVYKWTMSGGVFNPVPQVITCSDAIATGIASASVGPLPNGDFYWNSNGQNARKYAADGTLIGIIPGGVLATGTNAIRYLGQVGGSEYVVSFAFGAGNNNARVLEIPLGVPADATLFFATPTLGSATNVNGTGDVSFQINPDFTANIFVLTTNNGLGAYRSSDAVPVELSTFAAIVADRNVTLNWRTESETNSLGFEVERSSANRSWSQIGFVKSAGNSVSPKNYSFVDSKLETGTYSYRLKMVDLDGSFSYSNVVEVEIGTPVTYSLSQNYPNPFNPTTRIEYQVPFNANVKIELYSITGEKVVTLVNNDLSAGFYTMDVDASTLRLASGVYFYRMTSTDLTGNKFMDTKKMVLLK